MNERHTENALKIADYLEDKMDASGEEAFMQELGRDEELCRQYEEELLVRSLLGSSDEARLAQNGGTGKTGDRKPGRIMALFSRSGMIAAALVVIIAGSVLYIRLGHRNGQGGPIITETNKRAITPDSLKRYLPPSQGSIADTAFDRAYSPYPEKDDSASAADSGYIRLYKGLRYLAGNEPVNAIRQFDSILLSSRAMNDLYYTAQWYEALAWLKRKDIDPGIGIANATNIARSIIGSSSPYKQAAARLLQDLHSH